MLGQGLQQGHKYTELESPLRDRLLHPLAQRYKREQSGFQAEKGHLVAFSFHNSPCHTPNPCFLFFNISRDEIFS